eukprot:jgi/Picsp_1/578/NSC_00575-R1_sulfotransferase
MKVLKTGHDPGCRIERRLGDLQRTWTGNISKVAGVCLVGCGHSGTTFLARTVAQFPGVHCAEDYETGFLRFWPFVPWRRMKRWEEQAKELGFAVWIEKTPKHVHHVKKILQVRGMKIIFISRDGRAVSKSIKRRKGSFAVGVKRWVADNLAMQPFLDHEDVLSIKYEDLTNENTVLDVLRKMYAFLGDPGGSATDERLLLSLSPLEKTRAHPVKICEKFQSEEDKQDSLRRIAGNYMQELQFLLENKNRNTMESHQLMELERATNDWGESSRQQHNVYRSSQMKRFWFPNNDSAVFLSEEENKIFESNSKAVELMKYFKYFDV